MVMPPRIEQDDVYTIPVIFTGGTREDISPLDLKAGNLLSSTNVYETEGENHGYASIMGYEVYDGGILPSSVLTELYDEWITGSIYSVGDLVYYGEDRYVYECLVANTADGNNAPTALQSSSTYWKYKSGYFFNKDDTTREERRSATGSPSGSSGYAPDIYLYNGLVYAIADGELDKAVSVSSPSGWSVINAASTLLPNLGGVGDFEVASFDLLAPYHRQNVLFYVDGVNVPYYLGPDNAEYSIDEAGLTTKFLPDNQDTPVYATKVLNFKNRLWLAYPDGRLHYSAVGDPLNFDSVSGAGVIETGSPITNLIVAPGDTLIIFGRNRTRMLTAYEMRTGELTDYSFQMKDLSQRSGSLHNTAERVLGKIIYLDDRGITSLTATDAFGDFAAGIFSRNMQGTLMEKKSLVTCSIVNRELSQYRLFFSDGEGLICVMNEDNLVKSITKISYPIPVKKAIEGEDENGNFVSFFSHTDGYVYKMDSGTSFNGQEIGTYVKTSFNSYRSPSSWKRFFKISLGLRISDRIEFLGKILYNYDDNALPKNLSNSFITTEAGGTWGVDEWGAFLWGSEVSVTEPVLYTMGFGKNMSMELRTSSKFAPQYVLHHALVDFSVGDKSF